MQNKRLQLYTGGCYCCELHSAIILYVRPEKKKKNCFLYIFLLFLQYILIIFNIVIAIVSPRKFSIFHLVLRPFVNGQTTLKWWDRTMKRRIRETVRKLTVWIFHGCRRPLRRPGKEMVVAVEK